MTADSALARRAISLLDLEPRRRRYRRESRGSLRQRGPPPRPGRSGVRLAPFRRAMPLRTGGNGYRGGHGRKFPHGRPDIAIAVRETAFVIAEGADEVDVVLPYAAWLSGHRQHARRLVAACKEAVGKKRLKVILETGRLVTPAAIRGAADDAIEAGADFIKTSTGKTSVSATLEAAHIMLEAIRASGKPVGLKPSGGIRTPGQAAAYLRLADHVMGEGWAKAETFRFGASGLLGALGAVLDAEGSAEGTDAGGCRGEVT